MDLRDIDEEIAMLSITVGNGCSHGRYGALLKRHPTLGSLQPSASLQIPNALLILWTRKLALQCEQYNSVFKHSSLTELANQSIQGGDITISNTNTLELRLKKERSRIMNLHKRLKGGSRTKLENATTHVLLFENEITRYSSKVTTRVTVVNATATSSNSMELKINGKGTY